MFCQECGAENKDSSIFCEECGMKLDKPANNGLPRKPINTKTKIILGIVAVLILILGAYNVVKSQCSEERVAEKYFKNVMNAKWDNVYDDLDLAKSNFINKDQFIEVHKDQTKRKLYAYQVGPTKENQDELSTEVMITYQTSENLVQQYRIVLNKQAKKRFLFIDTWKVNPSEYILENYKIQVPNNTKVTFGGVDLGTNYMQKSDDYYSYYTLPKVLSGTYDIKVRSEEHTSELQSQR